MNACGPNGRLRALQDRPEAYPTGPLESKLWRYAPAPLG